MLALAQDGGEWGAAIVRELGQKSPTSLKVTLRQLRGGKGLEIEDVLIREYRMTQRFMAAHDFAEGVRALLIDKDQKAALAPAGAGRGRHADGRQLFRAARRAGSDVRRLNSNRRKPP